MSQPPPAEAADLPLPGRNARLAVAAAVITAAAFLAWGAAGIQGEAGYQGVGANFLPWVVAIALGLCGACLLVQALRDEASTVQAVPKSWTGFAWVSSAMLANAALITTIGFILSCALCFALAARGWRSATGKPLGFRSLGLDFAIGAAISAPVFWLFTRGLGVSLPALVPGGWI